ncbi:hypothetical protein [Cupriavidus agavae]|uniref:Uncharacterized protein n=1 Tax=Cupriavidus agavae TaxID=1001822 RepID=A0A4Q7S2B9_9BURK|nr:hypothetical protein [Cupriavidus agavae]RZT39607.1 hypothetical protein EV147_2802 [Cupriavidus agavae]
MTLRKTLLALSIALTAGLAPLAHASVGADARAFKDNFKADVKEAGRKTGHAVADAARAVGHGARAVGHAVADTSKRGYQATKAAIKGDEREARASD